jgi:perosamine synthetase
MIRIPVAAPDLSGNEERYVVEAIRSSWISSTGPFVERFERDFAALCGTRSAIAVANGTLALHLALLTVDLRPGDEVLVPSLTYIATANAVRYCGAEPVFVDVDPATWCMDPLKLEAAITRRTKGVIPVHLYGHPADMDAINHIAATHGLWVVEDAAESHLATYKGRRTGGLGRIGIFSFYGNKVLTSGEGGALTLDDPQLVHRARVLRGQGVDPLRRYFFPITGYNYRLTNVACALLCAQIERAPALLARRREIYARYRAGLAGIPGVGLQPSAPWAELSPWLFCVTIDAATFGRTRDELMAVLAEAGVETRPFFIPVHRLPPYVEESRRRGDVLPETDALGAAGLNLPTYTGMTDAQVDEVASLVGRAAAVSRGRHV